MKAFIVFFAIVITFSLTFAASQPSEIGDCEKDTDCQEGQFCSQGICKNLTEVQSGHVTSTPESCTDSDGGEDYFNKGLLKIHSEEHVDKCDDEWLDEYYCVGDYYDVTIYDCEINKMVCEDGACVQKCYDTDGLEVSTKGKVLYKDSQYDDFCIDEVTVKEYYCDENTQLDANITCEGSQTCIDGKCVIGVVSPDSGHSLEILPNVRVSSNPIDNIFGDGGLYGRVYPGHFIYNSVDPEIYYSFIKDYTDEEFYDQEEWRIITEYDKRFCMVNIRDSDPTHKIIADFEISGWTEGGTFESMESPGKCVTKGSGRWDCYAKFPPAKDLRTLKYSCAATVKDSNGVSVTAKSEPTIVARYVYPAVKANENEFPSEMKLAYESYKKMSDLKETIEEAIHSPKLSSKAVYYDVNIPVNTNEINNNYILFTLFNFGMYKDFVAAASVKFDPNKLDRLIVYSPSLVSNASFAFLPNHAGGFTKFNYPAAYLKTIKNDLKIIAHEFGHGKPISLCDEYSWLYYSLENIFLLPSGGCPNKFPKTEVEKEMSIRLSHVGWSMNFEYDWMKKTLLYDLKDMECASENSTFYTPYECEQAIEKMAREEFGDNLRSIDAKISQIWSTPLGRAVDSISITYDTHPSISGSVMNNGDFYPEVDPNHPLYPFYCPLKNC